MINRGIEYRDVKNAVRNGLTTKEGIEVGLLKYKAIGKRFGKYTTVIYLYDRGNVYVKTVWRSKNAEVKMYEKKRGR